MAYCPPIYWLILICIPPRFNKNPLRMQLDTSFIMCPHCADNDDSVTTLSILSCLLSWVRSAYHEHLALGQPTLNSLNNSLWKLANYKELSAGCEIFMNPDFMNAAMFMTGVTWPGMRHASRWGLGVKRVSRERAWSHHLVWSLCLNNYLKPLGAEFMRKMFNENFCLSVAPEIFSAEFSCQFML